MIIFSCPSKAIALMQMIAMLLCLYTLIYEDWEFAHHIVDEHVDVQVNFLFLSRLTDYGLAFVIFGMILGIARGDRVVAAVG